MCAVQYTLARPPSKRQSESQVKHKSEPVRALASTTVHIDSRASSRDGGAETRPVAPPPTRESRRRDVAVRGRPIIST